MPGAKEVLKIVREHGLLPVVVFLDTSEEKLIPLLK